MEIQLNPARLSKNQREALAAFILTFPADSVGLTASPVYGDPTPTQVAELETVFAKTSGLTIAQLQASGQLAAPIGDDAPDVGRVPPAEAFRPDAQVPACDPDRAFAQVIAPLVPTVAPAPSTAAVVQSPTAPEVLTPPVSVAATFVPSPPALTPAPVAPAPSAPAALTSPVGGVETDTDGLPWDARIHAGTKNKNADGRWKAKKGINDPAFVDRVKAELRQIMGPVPAVVSVPAGAGAVATVITPPAAPPAPVATPGVDNFVSLVGRAAAAIHGGKITQDEVNAIAAKWGVVSLPLAANRPDLVPSIAAEIDALIASR